MSTAPLGTTGTLSGVAERQGRDGAQRSRSPSFSEATKSWAPPPPRRASSVREADREGGREGARDVDGERVRRLRWGARITIPYHHHPGRRRGGEVPRCSELVYSIPVPSWECVRQRRGGEGGYHSEATGASRARRGRERAGRRRGEMRAPFGDDGSTD